MRHLIAGLTLLSFSVATLAQGMPGGGMGGGGMGGGGGRRGGGMGGGEGGRGGGMRSAGGAPRRQVEVKPIARDKLDKPVEAMFRAADLDGDGTVTLDELHAVLNARRETMIRDRFKTVDKNGDHMIDEREFIAWQESLGSLAADEEDAGGIDLGIVPDMLPPTLGKSPEDAALRLVIAPLSATVLIEANTNYDQGVTLPELLAYERKRFDAADADHDGTLSEAELRSLSPREGRRGPGAAGDGPRPQDALGLPPRPTAGD